MSIMLPLCRRSLRKSPILRRCVPSPRLRCGPESGVPDRKDYCREISDLSLCRRVRAGGTSPDRGPSNQMSLLEPSGGQQSRSQAKRGTEPEPLEHAEVQGGATCTSTPCGMRCSHVRVSSLSLCSDPGIGIAARELSRTEAEPDEGQHYG